MKANLTDITLVVDRSGSMDHVREDAEGGVNTFITEQGKEFTRAQLKKMIERQQDEFNWHFTFLGANQDAFAEAGGMGIHEAGVANYTVDKVAAAYMATGTKVARMRAQRSAGETVTNDFTSEEKEEMM